MARASLWISGARGIVNVLSIVSTIVVARLLTPADFGLVALGTSMLAIFAAITELSLSSALIHIKEPTDEHYDAAWTLGVLRAIVMAIILAGIGPIAADFYDEPRLFGVMLFLAISVIIGGITNPKLIVFQKKLLFRQAFWIEVVRNIVVVFSTIVLAVIFRTYWAILAGILIGQVVYTAMSYVFISYFPRIGWRKFKELWSFSLWLSLGQTVNAITFRIDHLMVGGFLGTTTLGHYTVGSNLAVAPTRESTRPLVKSLFPAFSLIAEDARRLRRAYQRAQTTAMALALPAGVGFALIADPFVRLSMGPSWAPAIPVVQVIATAHGLLTLANLASPLAMSLGRTRLLFNRTLQMFLIRVPLLACGMYFWGLPGLLVARAIAGLVSLAAYLFMVRSLIGLTMIQQVRANGRCIASCLAMIGVVLALQAALPEEHDTASLTIALLGSIIAGGMAYVGATATLWIMMNKPHGPETEAIDLLRKAKLRLKR